MQILFLTLSLIDGLGICRLMEQRQRRLQQQQCRNKIKIQIFQMLDRI